MVNGASQWLSMVSSCSQWLLVVTMQRFSLGSHWLPMVLNGYYCLLCSGSHGETNGETKYRSTNTKLSLHAKGAL